MINKTNKSILRRLHATSASPTYPGIHMQIMVRCGSVFCTVHSAFTPQGVRVVQGLRQTSLRQASRLPQSPSTRHSGSAISGSGTVTGARSGFRDSYSTFFLIIWLNAFHKYPIMASFLNLKKHNKMALNRIKKLYK